MKLTNRRHHITKLKSYHPKIDLKKNDNNDFPKNFVKNQKNEVLSKL